MAALWLNLFHSCCSPVFRLQSALAADCPGHPDALGTSRTLVVDPRAHPRIGTMQYPETLPLEDHEVVLTFDDGPLPRNSNQILAILASQCVKATFFEIGRMAQFSPEGVRKLRDAGHSIGTHSQNHPLTMNKMSIERARQEIDDGIASVKTALGDDAALAPFFRIPGLLRAEDVEDYLASQGIQVWSADFPADDWRHISSSRVYDLAINRLEDKGKGILLLHDIQARTVAALPRILATLKARGYRIVHVVPATSELPATPTEPVQWQLHPPSETLAISHWPKIPNFAFAEPSTLATPLLADWDGPDGQLMTLGGVGSRARGMGVASRCRAKHPGPGKPSFRRRIPRPPCPFRRRILFEIPEKSFAAIFPRTPRLAAVLSEPETKDRAKRDSAEGGESRQAMRGKHYAARNLGRSRQHGTARVAGRGNKPAAHAPRGPLKRLVQAKKRNV